MEPEKISNIQYSYDESSSLTSHENIGTDSIATSNPLETTPVTTIFSRSKVWEHYTKGADFKNNKKVTCKYCKTIYTCSGGSTSNMIKHLEKIHPSKINLITSNSSIDSFFKTKVNLKYFFKIKKILLNLIYI